MDEQEGNRCLICNKESALALFGIAIGLMFVFMGVDILRRSRLAQSTVEGEVTSDD